MNCEHCNKILPEHKCSCSEPHHYILSQEKKPFCNMWCLESYYINKIQKLTKSEHAWHEEWFKQRDIVGRLGLELLYIKNPSYKGKGNVKG